MHKHDLSRHSDSAKAPGSRGTDIAKADRRFAWWLVWLYPPRFRRDVGLGLADAIEDRVRIRRARGASALGAAVPAILDTLKNAPAERAGAASGGNDPQGIS